MIVINQQFLIMNVYHTYLATVKLCDYAYTNDIQMLYSNVDNYHKEPHIISIAWHSYYLHAILPVACNIQ